jgi:flagellar assembly factor FliW
MPECQTRNFGKLEYREDSVLHFPAGLPGFDEERSFVLVEQPATKPLAFVQSLSRADLCFIALPVLAVDPRYRTSIASEDLQILGLQVDCQPSIGEDVLCLAIVSAPKDGPATVNLLAPVIVNLKTRVSLQAIQIDAPYSHQHPLFPAPEEARC